MSRANRYLLVLMGSVLSLAVMLARPLEVFAQNKCKTDASTQFNIPSPLKAEHEPLHA